MTERGGRPPGSCSGRSRGWAGPGRSGPSVVRRWRPRSPCPEATAPAPYRSGHLISFAASEFGTRSGVLELSSPVGLVRLLTHTGSDHVLGNRRPSPAVHRHTSLSCAPRKSATVNEAGAQPLCLHGRWPLSRSQPSFTCFGPLGLFGDRGQTVDEIVSQYGYGPGPLTPDIRQRLFLCWAPKHHVQATEMIEGVRVPLGVRRYERSPPTALGPGSRNAWAGCHVDLCR